MASEGNVRFTCSVPVEDGDEAFNCCFGQLLLFDPIQ